jgi:hypothetical protein
MTEMKSLFRAVILFVASLALSAAGPSSRYAEGQIWEYQTRSQEVGSLVKIQKIEKLADQKVYHVSVIGVRLKKPGMSDVLPHLPVSEATLDASLIRLSPHPNFPTLAVDEGIAEWRAAKGGVFTIPISDILNAVDEMMK